MEVNEIKISFRNLRTKLEIKHHYIYLGMYSGNQTEHAYLSPLGHLIRITLEGNGDGDTDKVIAIAYVDKVEEIIK